VTVLDILRPRTTHNAQQRGWQYLSRVRALTGDASSVTAEVHGSEVYDVEIRTVGDTLRVWCSCPYFADRSSGCKHLWATAVLAHENGWLTELPPNPRVLMDFADAEDIPFGVLDHEEQDHGNVASPIEAEGTPPEWAVALAAVAPPAVPDVAPPLTSGSQLRYVLSAPAHAVARSLPLFVEQVDRKRDGTWSKPHLTRLSILDIAHLPDPDDRWVLSLLQSTSAFASQSRISGYAAGEPGPGVAHLNGPLLDVLLPRLCATGRVRVRHGSRHVPVVAGAADPGVPLRWDPDTRWRFALVVVHEPGDEGGEGNYRVDAVLQRQTAAPDSPASVSLHRFEVLTDTIAVLDHVAAHFDPAGGFAWAGQLRARGALAIPAASRRALVESLARSAVEHVELPEELRWEEREAPPRFGIVIGRPHESSGACQIELFVEYGGTTGALADGSTRLLSADGRVMYRRDPEAEARALETLTREGVAGVEWHLRRGASVSYRRVPALVHALVDAGWIVQAEGVRYRAIDAPGLRVRSGIDWFQIETAGDAQTPIPLTELLDAIKSGRRTITLGDGTVGMLPEEWLARVAPVLALGEVGEDAIRFKPSQAMLIDALLAAQPGVDWDEGFARARDALRRFERIEAEEPPPTFRGELRAYQKEALGWMRFLRTFGFGGCLADDMGLGKTVMVLAMLDARRTDPDRRHRPSLVVMPRSLIFNWKSEAARFAPQLRVVDFAHAERRDALDTIVDADVLLTTYGTLRRDVPALGDHQFDYVVLDEAQAIKNAATVTAKAVRLLRADHRLALTGTPVENHLGELQSLFEFLNPGLLGTARWLSGAAGRQLADDDGYVARLGRGLRPFFLRRTKEHVTPELPPRTEETLYCELDGPQALIYDQLRQHYRASLLKQIDRDGLARSRFAILEALLRLRQAASHTALLPQVRRGASAKFDLLLPRLAELVGEGRKALVYSQFTTLLQLLRPLLDAEGITYEYLDGQTRDREARVARFQEDPSCSLFLISLKAGGVGLNLTAAEYVFLLDPWWNPAVEMQAIDRTHRIGQERPVFAYRLVARDTVEERILELQSHKRELADAILVAGAGGLRTLKREDLEVLLG
jgi:superfamily II DNA or RNA helicase